MNIQYNYYCDLIIILSILYTTVNSCNLLLIVSLSSTIYSFAWFFILADLLTLYNSEGDGNNSLSIHITLWNYWSMDRPIFPLCCYFGLDSLAVIILLENPKLVAFSNYSRYLKTYFAHAFNIKSLKCFVYRVPRKAHLCKYWIIYIALQLFYWALADPGRATSFLSVFVIGPFISKPPNGSY